MNIKIPKGKFIMYKLSKAGHMVLTLQDRDGNYKTFRFYLQSKTSEQSLRHYLDAEVTRRAGKALSPKVSCIEILDLLISIDNPKED